jgi:hypothetical protein
MYGYFNPDSVEASALNRIPYLCTIDPYTFNIKEQVSYNQIGSVNNVEVINDYAFVGVFNAITNENNYPFTNLYKYNVNNINNSIDSLIVPKDSIRKLVTQSSSTKEDALVLFSSEEASTPPDYNTNYIKLYDLNFNIIAEQAIIDSNENSVSNEAFIGSYLYFTYSRYSPSSIVLSKAANFSKLVSTPSERRIEETDNITLFPNPASSHVNILSNSTPLEYELFNIKGQRVKSGTLKSNNAQLNVSSLNNGVYFLKIGSKTKKIIIQRNKF